MVRLIAPHGGTLVNRVISQAESSTIRERLRTAPHIELSAFSQSDLMLIAIGVYSPLTGFMNQADYESVLENMTLASGLSWTLPVTLPVIPHQAESLSIGDEVALVDADNTIWGSLTLKEKYTVDLTREAQTIYRTTDIAHPGVARLMQQGKINLAGEVVLFEDALESFADLPITPQQTRAHFTEQGWRRVVAFQTRNPIHRAHEYLMKCALELTDGLLLHPLIGQTKADDLPADVRIASYRAVLDHYFPAQRTLLAGFPAAMRYAGPREAVFHALCRKNYGCSHFIVGRDHAGVGDYYGTYDAQHIFDEFDPQAIGITPLMFEHAFYCKGLNQIATAKTTPFDSSHWFHLSGTQVRARLRNGEILPEELTRPEVSHILIAALHESGAAD